MSWRATLMLVLVAAGCGGAPSAPRRSSDAWRAHPPTESGTCSEPLGACPQSASLRLHWQRDVNLVEGTFSVDGEPIDGAEFALGTCASPGMHRVGIDAVLRDETGNVSRAVLTLNAEILAGIETRVVLTPSPTGVQVRGAMVANDLGVTVAALGDAELPAFDRSLSPEERRLFVLALGPSFDAWRVRLARVSTLARELDHAALMRAGTELEARAEALAGAIAEVRPSADRVDAILRAMRSEIERSASMIEVDRTCPVYREQPDETSLVPVSIEARPYQSEFAVVTRMRVAIDDIEALDHAASEPESLRDHAVADGLVPTGQHLVVVEAIFHVRGGSAPGTHRIFVERPVAIPAAGARIQVRASDSGAGSAMARDPLVEIVASPGG